MVNIKEIYWVAGILEGEGYFGFKRSPRIIVSMSDYDTMEKVKNILNAKSINATTKSGYKTQYRVELSGLKAIGWMYILYQLMSIRRKDKIKSIINKYNLMIPRKGFCRKGLHGIIEGSNAKLSWNSNRNKYIAVCKGCYNLWYNSNRKNLSVTGGIN